MDVENINALFGHTLDPMIYHIESTLILPTLTKENVFPQTRPRIERWDLSSSSSREGKIRFTLFNNPLIMGDHEEEVEQEA